ncbi:MAG: transglycosylase SLT domain-containing protein [Gemmatimonadetes bacterium]|nr:transglycosylase SLT domain-containing protein [Gemmatimonadota bacterium]
MPRHQKRCKNPFCKDFVAKGEPICVACRVAGGAGMALLIALLTLAKLVLEVVKAVTAPAIILVIASPVCAQPIPRAALQYQRPLIANARAVWGLNAPIAVMAAQVHQESGWRPDAKSAYAGGLAQFTPATAEWISAKYTEELGANQPFEPAWALRALARYDKFLYDRQSRAATPCDRWAFTLSSYNGGEGWLTKQKAATTRAGDDATRWFRHVEQHRVRAAWAHDENVAYPRAILVRRQPPYRAWGPGVDCDVELG